MANKDAGPSVASDYRVCWHGEYPQKKRLYHDGTFSKRRKAYQWCRNHRWHPGLRIVHPDGTEEPFR